ncbi:sugar kinase [Stieleria sp. TO1_6]|uniref:sugar kinase n=1 Tax=Stieleria tagensis TaxID=2956795 RepID=UPI00209B599E|nr:sugar kinase [Stieleria tagensis]MCO8120577.1 sugar kinase [Stieleria tagensis]
MSRFVTLGEIMVRLSTPGFQRFEQALPGSLETNFGGAEASVAALINRLGGDAAFVTALPENALGRSCLATLKRQGVNVDHVLLTDKGRMGLYFVEHGVNQRPGQVIYDRDQSSCAITPASDYDWEAIFADAVWLVISGITPALSSTAADLIGVVLGEAETRGIQVACDMNYRSKLWRWHPSDSPEQLAATTMQRIVGRIDLLICGRSDAVMTLGIDDDSEIESLASEISRQYPRLSRIAMTRRRSVSSTHQSFAASLYDVNRRQMFHAPDADGTYEITDVVDRIGTGDAFYGALLFAIDTDELSDSKSAVAFATAAACLAHSISGDFSLISRDEIEALVQGDGAGRIVR